MSNVFEDRLASIANKVDLIIRKKGWATTFVNIRAVMRAEGLADDIGSVNAVLNRIIASRENPEVPMPERENPEVPMPERENPEVPMPERKMSEPMPLDTKPVGGNTPIEGHALIGTRHTYHAASEGYTPYDPDADTEGGMIVLGNNWPVKILQVYEDWNGVEDLLMLYVWVWATSTGTHVTPKDLGLDDDDVRHGILVAQGRCPACGRKDDD